MLGQPQLAVLGQKDLKPGANEPAGQDQHPANTPVIQPRGTGHGQKVEKETRQDCRTERQVRERENHRNQRSATRRNVGRTRRIESRIERPETHSATREAQRQQPHDSYRKSVQQRIQE